MQFLLCFTRKHYNWVNHMHSIQHSGLSTCAEHVHQSLFCWDMTLNVYNPSWSEQTELMSREKNERQNHSCLYRVWKQKSFWRRNTESKLSSATGKYKQLWMLRIFRLAVNGPEKHCQLCCSTQTGLPKRNVTIYTRVRGKSDRGQVHKAEERMY